MEPQLYIVHSTQLTQLMSLARGGADSDRFHKHSRHSAKSRFHSSFIVQSNFFCTSK